VESEQYGNGQQGGGVYPRMGPVQVHGIEPSCTGKDTGACYQDNRGVDIPDSKEEECCTHSDTDRPEEGAFRTGRRGRDKGSCCIQEARDHHPGCDGEERTAGPEKSLHVGSGKNPADHHGRHGRRQKEQEGIGKRDAVCAKRVEEEDHSKAESTGDRTGEDRPMERAEPDLEHVHGTRDECLPDAEDRQDHAGEDTADNGIQGDTCRLRVLQQAGICGKEEDLEQPGKVHEEGNDQQP